MGQTSSLQIDVKNSETITYLRLNGIEYIGIVYNGFITGSNPPVAISVIDSKTISGINGALGDIVMAYKGTPNANFNILNLFNAIMLSFGPPPPCTQALNPFPIQCADANIDSTGRRIVFQMSALTISPVGDIVNTFDVTFGAINSSYLLSDDQSSNALNFFVPDYFVQAQNDNKLDAKTTWSYMPNFDLALHKPTTQKPCRCKEKYEKCKKRYHKHSEDNFVCKCKPKPFTNTTDIHNLLSKIYNIAYLVEIGKLAPASGEAQVTALWKSFEKFEVKDTQNFKSIDVNGNNGIVTMLVRYRILNSEIIVAMSITGTYLNNIFFNVSTIPISGDNEPDAKHSFNKAISQYVTNISTFQ
jgi:hypothetical protein